MISFSPTEEQQMIVSMAKQFANDEMRKVYRQCDEDGTIPAGIIDTVWKPTADLAENVPLSQVR
jgi:hypothetical protein